MKKIISYTPLLLLLVPGITVAACPDGVKPGVLTDCEPSGTLAQYAKNVLEDNMGYIVLIAIVLIVFSGLHYMLSVGQAGEQTKAKQRITGILGGLAFYFIIEYIMKLLV